MWQGDTSLLGWSPGKMMYKRHDSVSSSASQFPGDEVSRPSYTLRMLGFWNTAGDPELRTCRSFRRICKPMFPLFWRQTLSLSYWKQAGPRFTLERETRLPFSRSFALQFPCKDSLKKKIVSASLTRHAETWETLEKCLPIVITPFPQTNQQNGLVISHPTQSMD